MKTFLLVAIVLFTGVSSQTLAQESDVSLSFKEALSKLPDLRYSFIACSNRKKIHNLEKWQRDVIAPSSKNSENDFLGQLIEDAEWHLDIRITNRVVNEKFQRRYEQVQPKTEQEELKIYKKAGQSVNFVNQNVYIIHNKGYEEVIKKELSEGILVDTSEKIDGRAIYEFKGKFHHQNEGRNNIFLIINAEDSEVIVSSETSFLKKYILVKQGIEFPASDDDLWELFEPATLFLKDQWIIIVPEKIEDILEQQSQAYGYSQEKKDEMREKLKDTFFAGRAFSKHVEDGVLVDITFDFRPVDTPLRKMLEYKQTSVNVRKNAMKNWSRNFDSAIGRVKVWHKDNYIVTEVRSRNLKEAWEYGYSKLVLKDNPHPQEEEK